MSINELMENSDIIIEVVDSRVIDLSRIKDIEDKVIRGGKELIVVASKADLVPEKKLKDKLLSIPYKTAYFSYKERKGVRSIKMLLHQTRKKMRKDKIRIGIVGYANIGKSSLISLLTHSQKAKNAPVPGYTKGVKWIRLSKEFLLIDTPGIYKEKIKNPLLSNIDPEKNECYDYAIFLIESILGKDDNLQEVLGINLNGKDAHSIIKEYAVKRNFLMKGREYDVERAAKDIIRKWNKGEIKAFIP